MVICGGRNLVVDFVMCGDSVLRQFSDTALLLSQVCISVMQFLSTFMSLLGSVNLSCTCMSSAYE